MLRVEIDPDNKEEMKEYGELVDNTLGTAKCREVLSKKGCGTLLLGTSARLPLE
jgi:hypothetical protein